ncbi:hypothetical protein Taro_014409 [Colocasia esculenta]|uniref:Retrotransposon gag domain-containing protein n=1 Tax=Colocasia esculenta TaxID=4460 RepID=A0A843UIZ0_COLES|nr:hypothetical protein [Colocasia esculenta]
MPIPQPFFPSYNRTPKHHGYLNYHHPNPRDEFRTCWGRVEEFLVAGEQEIIHTKPFFFPFLSAATCTNHPLEVDQRNFKSLNPPRFSGSPDPDEAENWQEEIERIFQVMQCTNREKVVLATFQFTKDARAWWKATSAHLPNVAELEWAGFLEIFRGKYFSERVKEKKAAEFSALK